jgi:hypothetical protein
LDLAAKVSKNSFTPETPFEREIVGRLVERGWMAQHAESFHLTVEGFSALDGKRKLVFGVVG